MAEQIIVVCDVCGRTPTKRALISIEGTSHSKDLCAEHVAELLANTHAPRRGRPPKASTPESSPQPARRRGRPPRLQASAERSGSEATPRRRRKITDPEILAKRRAALEKARAARAAKRAANA